MWVFFLATLILPLKGPWAVQISSDSFPPREVPVKTRKLPFLRILKPGQRLWLYRRITIPDRFPGQQVRLYLNGARYSPVIWVDGKRVAKIEGGTTPLSVDLSHWLTPGVHEVWILLQDWTALLSPPLTLSEWAKLQRLWGQKRLRLYKKAYRFLQHRLTILWGGRFWATGLDGSVWLEVVPSVNIKNIHLWTTGLYPPTFELRLRIENAHPRQLRRVLRMEILTSDQKRMLARWVDTVRLAPGVNRWKTRLTVPAASPWWPDTPRLYILRLTLGDDQREIRVGFRTFTLQGDRFVLNGKPIVLCGTAGEPPPEPLDSVAIRNVLLRLKRMHVRILRTHTRVWPEMWYDLADELGILVVAEAGWWNDDWLYALNRETFWESYKRDLRRMVAALGNHPSVVMWSLGNEVYGPYSRGQDVEQRLVEVMHYMRTLDPSRPVYFEGDGDPGGAADVIGLHYPHQHPAPRLWPRAAFAWNQKDPRLVAYRGTSLLPWDHRKPLMIGEYLWWPMSTPAPATLLLGDDAYRMGREAPDSARAWAWVWQARAYRHGGVSGFVPWTVLYWSRFLKGETPLTRALTRVCDPVQLWFRRPDRDLWEGDVWKDTLEASVETPPDAAWRLELWAGEVDGSLQRVHSQSWPSGALHVDIPVSLPTKSLRGKALRIRAVLRDEENILRVVEKRVVLHERRGQHPSLHATDWVIWDPSGRLEALFPEIPRMHRLDAWKGTRLLLVAPDAWPRASFQARAHFWKQVEAGGQVLMLAQPPGVQDLPVPVDPVRSTVAFPVPGVTWVQGWPERAFRWWGPNQLLSEAEMRRIARRGVVYGIVTGGPQGLHHALGLMYRLGRGRMLWSQFLPPGGSDTSPWAQKWLERWMQTLESPVPPAVSLVLEGSPPSPFPAAWWKGISGSGQAILRVMVHLQPGPITRGVDMVPWKGEPLILPPGTLREDLYFPGPYRGAAFRWRKREVPDGVQVARLGSDRFAVWLERHGAHATLHWGWPVSSLSKEQRTRVRRFWEGLISSLGVADRSSPTARMDVIR